MNSIHEFRTYRAKMNKVILDADNLFFKRFFNLDTRTYEDGALSSQVKEMLDSGASLVQIYTGFIYNGPSLIKKSLKYIVNNL